MGEAASLAGRPFSQATPPSAALSGWGEDSDHGPARHTTAHAPRSGTARLSDIETDQVPPSQWGNDGGGSDDAGDSLPTRPTRTSPGLASTSWGDESDDDNDDRVVDDDGIPRFSSTSGTLMTATAANTEQHAVEASRWRRAEESSAWQLPEEFADTSWGSDDDDGDFACQPSRFSQPFRMGAAAAGVASTGVVNANPVRTPTAHASTSWGDDGEDGEESSNDDSFSPVIPGRATRPDLSAHWPPPPARLGPRDVGTDEGVVAPLWMPHARGRSGLVEPDRSWADEAGGGSEDNGTTGPRRTTDGVHRTTVARDSRHPGRSELLPGFDFVDITGDADGSSPRAVHFASTDPGPAATPLTMPPSPSWSSTFGLHSKGKPPAAGRGGGGGGGGHDGGDGRYPWNSRPATQSPFGGALFGRRSAPNAAASRRAGAFGATESSPMHEALAQVDANKHASPEPTTVAATRSWFRRLFRSTERFRRRSGKEEAVARTPGGEVGEKEDGRSDVRAWGWRDSFKNAPGLVGRLGVCILAVCALWATSLNVVGEDRLTSTMACFQGK